MIEVKIVKESIFEETPVGRIPKDWKSKKVLDLFTVETGTTPSTKRKDFWSGGTINWITPTDLSKLDNHIQIKSSGRKITDKALKETNLTLIPKGSIILSTRAPVGYVAVIENPATFNQGCKGLVSRNPLTISPHFYGYYLSTKKQALQNLSSGSTFLELSKERLAQFSVPYPPVADQIGAVRIIETVDSAIELTNNVVKKTERLKKGLMQQLLTHGIGHTEYKFSKELGTEIPIEWHVVRAGQICRPIVPGRNKPRKFDGDIPWITLPDIQGIEISESKSGLNITMEEIAECGNKLVPAQSVIMNCIGEFGVVGIATKDIVLNQQLHAFVCPDNVDPYFLALCLMSQVKYMQSVSTKTVVPYMNKENCNSVPIPLPALDEQKKIAEIISEADRKIDVEKREKAKLEKIKHGLMDLLLTGKVRIKVD